ncbi:hypothetical protein SAMN05216388_100314 [Halorientalis persicus]|uniref:Uncharacterized protein n=1 Tax=Halorientalis persicus TaxID=1367881 RepID=A0A1H8G7K2_9EURY|nr:hypothetical protein [Halorientalis persicus]SEN39714.1 hypothetical protein SAMN05216388_100314 [Halorientalis persicus]
MFDADGRTVTDPPAAAGATLRRDGVLAGGALVALIAAGTLIGGDPFLDPRAPVVGVGGALAIEAAFLRYPDRLLALWARPAVALVGVGAVAGLGVLALWRVPWLLGALTWGLMTYLVLLACVLLGVGNPLAALPGLGDRE